MKWFAALESDFIDLLTKRTFQKLTYLKILFKNKLLDTFLYKKGNIKIIHTNEIFLMNSAERHRLIIISIHFDRHVARLIPGRLDPLFLLLNYFLSF